MKRLLLIPFLLVLFPAAALALNVQLLRPSTGAVKGFRLFTSETLPDDRLAAGFILNWDHEPFEVATKADDGVRKRGIVDDFLTLDAVLSYGIRHNLTANVDLPVNAYFNVAPEFIPARARSSGDIGDLSFNLKYQLFDANKTRTHLGMAVVPFMTLPTGNKDHNFGDASSTGGLWLVADGQFKSNRIYLNIGSRFRKEETIRNLTVADEFLYGLGFQRPLWKKYGLDIILEASGSTTYRQFFSDEVSSPLDTYALIQKRWYRGEQAARALPEEEYLILKGAVHFKTASPVIQPDSYAVLNDLVRQINDHPRLKTIEIQGHTDWNGSVSYNQNLSDLRAHAVRDYLIQKGISPARLTAVGYGKLRPIATNETAEGRSLNRRVMAKILDQKTSPVVAASTGCRDLRWVLNLGGGGIGILRGYGTADWRAILGVSYVFPPFKRQETGSCQSQEETLTTARSSETTAPSQRKKHMENRSLEDKGYIDEKTHSKKSNRYRYVPREDRSKRFEPGDNPTLYHK